MHRIPPLDPTATHGPVKTLLEGVTKSLGLTPNLFRTAARSPAALEGLVALFGAAAKDALGAATREAVALAISELNQCDYCLSAHAALGARAGLNADAIARARNGESSDPTRAAALRLARTVAAQRGRVSDAELSEARRAGLTDAQVLDVVANVALTTFTNYLNLVAQTDIDFPVVQHAEPLRPGATA